jgi:hypothetical protein
MEISVLVPTRITAGPHPCRLILKNMFSEMRCAVQNSRIDIASGGPRIGGFVGLALHCGSLCAIGSTAPGSALGGPGLRLVGSAVTIGLRPVTSPRAIAVASLKLDGARYGRCLIFPKGRSGETGELLVDQKSDQHSNVTFVRIVLQLVVNPLS